MTTTAMITATTTTPPTAPPIAAELLDPEDPVDPVADPGSAFCCSATTGSMSETPRTCEPVEAAIVRILPFMASPIVALTPPPVQVAIADEEMLGIGGV